MTMSEPFYEDEYLLSLLRQDNQEAFTQIYNKYYSMLYSLSYRYLQDRELSEDVVQQVYLRLWESRSSCRIAVSLKNYLYTMAKNHLLNVIRDKNEWVVGRYEATRQESEIADDGLQEKIEEERKFNCFYRAVRQLPDSKRKICLLKIQGGLNNQEIADRLNMPVGTVKNYYTQSIRLLKYYLKKTSQEEVMQPLEIISSVRFQKGDTIRVRMK